LIQAGTLHPPQQKRQENVGGEAGKVVGMNGKIREFPIIFFFFNDTESKLKVRERRVRLMRKGNV